MAREIDLIHWNDCLYIPLHSVPIAGGIFLPTSADSIDQHLELPPGHDGNRDLNVNGVKIPPRGLQAARLKGNSMIERNILDGDIVIFQCSEFDYPENDNIVVIERLGDEEGVGAWSLKKLVIDRLSSSRNEFGDALDFENPTVILRSYNKEVNPWLLNPSGQYRIHGIYRRSIRAEDARLVDSEMLRAIAAKKWSATDPNAHHRKAGRTAVETSWRSRDAALMPDAREKGSSGGDLVTYGYSLAAWPPQVALSSGGDLVAGFLDAHP
jgi:Peptidase S24-like